MKEKLLELLKRTDLTFSTKERKVLEGLSQGLSSKEVAAKARISRKAVNNTVTTLRNRGFEIPELKEIKNKPGRKKAIDYLKPIDKTTKTITVEFGDELLIRVKVSEFLKQMLVK